MYCGSCLRDSALAAALIAQGRDVTLIPLYTPLRTDGRDVSTNRVFYGGLSLALRQRIPWFRRLPASVTKTLDAPWLLRAASRFAVRTDPGLVGDLTLSMLSGQSGVLRAEVDRLIKALGKLEPDLVNLPNLMFVGSACAIKEALDVPVVCTLGGEDLFLDGLAEPYGESACEMIRERCHDIDAFIAVTDYYADHAAERFALPRERIHVVPLGIDVSGYNERPARPERPFTIGYMARVCPTKGLRQLADTVIALIERGRDCRLKVAGYRAPAVRSYLASIQASFAERGLAHVFEDVGEVTRAGKIELLRTVDLVSVPSVYREAKGLYVLEAMAAGVPVVQPAHGSFPELIKASGGGVLYDPTEPEAAPGVIGHLMDDAILRAELGAAGREAVRTKFTAEIMAESTWQVYERLCETTKRA